MTPLTSAQICARLRISPRTLYRIRHRDDTFPKPLAQLSTPRKLKFDAQQVMAWYEKLKPAEF